MKIDITVPDKLSEITLGQYQKFLKIQKESEDERFLSSKMIEIFCNVNLSKVMNLKLSDVNGICSILSDMFNEKPALRRRFFLNGVEYGFVPNLEDISFGEYVDLDNYLSDWEMMDKAMGVLYRPIKTKYGERYSIEEYNASDTGVMKDMPLDAALGAVLFFYHLGIDLSTTILNYLEHKEETALQQYLNLAGSGDGINLFTRSLKEMLQDMKISLN
jgi:hypothetical protein